MAVRIIFRIKGMQSRLLRLIVPVSLMAATLAFVLPKTPDWGFFGHRRINRLATFTLPPEMIRFYKTHLEYITEHSVDPDKRRYATKHEAPRHYIDLDQWGVYPFSKLPRYWTDVLLLYTEIGLVTAQGDSLRVKRDTLLLDGYKVPQIRLYRKNKPILEAADEQAFRDFFVEKVMSEYYEDEWILPCDTLLALFGDAGPTTVNCISAYAVDHFSEHGILPYHLVKMQNTLKYAFLDGNVDKILRTSAEMGHYIGDAYVPLHTTKNYNGQLTNQTGIHAFWESRLPELFADETYDFFVGAAEYISNPSEYYWKIVLDSHLLVDSVLQTERELSRQFPPDRQYCFEERNGVTIRTQCKEYSEAYHSRMSGMVESRMRGAVLSIGSAWYTAWVDAGQPDLSKLLGKNLSAEELKALESLESQYQKGNTKGRPHD
ncbi:MAG: zinc dependent phospholipase C family protein [Saprospiraceae bacterium]